MSNFAVESTFTYYLNNKTHYYSRGAVVGILFIQFGMILPTKLVSKQYQVLGGVLVGQGYVTRCVIHTNATVVHIVIAITQSQ